MEAPHRSPDGSGGGGGGEDPSPAAAESGSSGDEYPSPASAESGRSGGEYPSPAAAESGRGGDKDPSPAAAESGSSSGQEVESRWLAALSEPELVRNDLLISLRELAVMRAKTAGHADLRYLFDLRMLRALGVVLLEDLKERLKEACVNPNGLDRLALLSDPDVEFTNSASDPEVVRPNKDQSTPNCVNKKRAHMQDGCHDEEVAKSHKKRKLGEKM